MYVMSYFSSAAVLRLKATFGYDMAIYYLITWLLTSHAEVNLSSDDLIPSAEFCDTEAFKPICGENEVVVITRASYGRMKLGRCVETSLGHVGCKTDVATTADRRCSGRRVCEIRVPDAEFEKNSRCHRELKSYLEISYYCQTVETVTAEFCQENVELPVSQRSGVGHIASIMTSDLPQCDGSKHPWVISGLPGQRVNLTLYDFTVDQSTMSFPTKFNPANSDVTNSSTSQLRATNKCRKYGLLKETTPSSVDRSVTICGTDRRSTNFYLSKGHQVKIWITAGLGPRDLQRFLIQYHIVGCPEPVVPGNAWFERTDDGHGVIGCRRSDVNIPTITWRIECGDDYKWSNWFLPDELYRNCSMPATLPLEQKTITPALPPLTSIRFMYPVVYVSIILIAVTVISLAVIAIKSVVVSRSRHRCKDSISNKPNSSTSATSSVPWQPEGAPDVTRLQTGQRPAVSVVSSRVDDTGPFDGGQSNKWAIKPASGQATFPRRQGNDVIVPTSDLY